MLDSCQGIRVKHIKSRIFLFIEDKMLKSYKFRLYLNKQQEEKLLWTLDRCKYTYNFLLSELQQQKVIDKAQIQGLIPNLKICEPELKKFILKHYNTNVIGYFQT